MCSIEKQRICQHSSLQGCGKTCAMCSPSRDVTLAKQARVRGNKTANGGFEVLAAGTTNSTIFWDVYAQCEDASRNGYLPGPCACLVWRQPRGETMPVGVLTCSKMPRCELFALTGLPRVLLFKMGNEKCRLLIDLHKDHRSLWDPKHKNYHNSTRREDSMFLPIHQNSMYHNKRHCSKSTR
jgi:hypothetical protein